ncbi:TSUP family transporter [Tissierella sp.]|uniref:TSUP family transporter n=1 Tax=Tissierella sp. TaxID=41274 RepID=UPI00286E3E25|nr:TSUP family transporter [Tissierella sp.]
MEMILGLIGFLSGIISGMGIGGGTILIPSLVIFYSLEQQKAQGVNLMVFLPVAIVALITHYKKGNIDFSFAKLIILGGIGGAIIGSFIALKIDPLKLRKYFGFFLLVVGAIELFKKKE